MKLSLSLSRRDAVILEHLNGRVFRGDASVSEHASVLARYPEKADRELGRLRRTPNCARDDPYRAGSLYGCSSTAVARKRSTVVVAACAAASLGEPMTASCKSL